MKSEGNVPKFETEKPMSAENAQKNTAFKKYGSAFDGLEELSKNSPELITPAITLDELREICGGDEILESLLSETLEQFEEYAKNVAELKENSEKLNNGEITIEQFNLLRDRQHDTHQNTVNAVRILVRNLAQKGKDTKWAEDFFRGGQENRAAIGKFALLTVFHQIKSSEEKSA